MSTLHVRHIESALDSELTSLVDLSDVSNAPEEEQRRTCLSRALAAFPVMAYVGATAPEVALGITDGPGDNGIDLVHYDLSNEKLYVVQAKWTRDGNGSPEVGDVQKFLQGIKDLANLKFDRFNDKMRKLQRHVTAALDNPRVTIDAIFVHTGAQEQSQQVTDLYLDLHAAMNDGGDIISLRTLRQADVHALVSGEVEGAGIDLDVALFDWGLVSEPYAAYYGQVAASDVAAWHREHSSALFSRNLRKFITDSDVNAQIVDSLSQSPETFWYFNNGITILCSSIVKKAIGGADRKHGQFSCTGVSIVNGAQTVGAIGQALSAADPNSIIDGRVLARVISLESCPPDFGLAVTRATNTQNRIVSRDFVALDDQQERLRVEMRIEGRTYALKTGDPDPLPEDGCSVVDATVALACADSEVSTAVQAKREIGRIWLDTTASIYKRLFNPGTTSTRLWRAVQVMRLVDERLSEIQNDSEGRRRQVAVHGNRLILHIVYSLLDPPPLDESSPPPNRALVRAKVDTVFEDVCAKVEKDYDSNYLASLFKNNTKCRDVADVAKGVP